MDPRELQVLVVDPQPSRRIDLHRQLEALGCRVLCAADAGGARALINAQSAPIDVAVMDHPHPGSELIDTLQERDRTIRIVLTVAEDYLEDVPDGHLALRRPIAARDLAQIVIALRVP